MVNQCLTIFFSKSYVSLGTSQLDEAKKTIKAWKKYKCKKCQWLTHLFIKKLFIHNPFVLEKSVHHCHFFIDKKSLQKLSHTAELISD